MWWLESNKQPFVSFCSASNHWTLAWKWQLDFSCSAMRTLALDQTCCFFRIKKSDNSIVKKRVGTSAPEFSGISPEFSSKQNFWGCTCPLSSTPLNGQPDINLEKSFAKKQNIHIFQLSAPAITVASPFHWIIHVVNNNLKKSCLLHLKEIHDWNLIYLGFQRLENLS